jgi:hypothetical protein
MLPPTHLIFAALAILVACHSARAQDDTKLPTLETPKSGVAQTFPVIRAPARQGAAPPGEGGTPCSKVLHLAVNTLDGGCI